ncbi:MAG: DUF4349 domain-containing protein [Oscillospiraceae bacterium]|nr:DUF4349 domain-containing protein [Oscillospiraceae bacterium]
MKRISLILALAFAVLLALTACSASESWTNSAGGSDMAYPEAPAQYDMDGGMYITAIVPEGDALLGASGGPPPAGNDRNEFYNDQLTDTDPSRKLIRRADLSFETTDFDDAVNALEQLCYSFEGYIQNSNVTGVSITHGFRQMRRAYYTLRVPSVWYGAFLNSADGIGNRINKSLSSEDITDSYYDIESRLEILTMRRDRLFKLLEESEEAESIVAFERELSDTLYQIERMTGQLKSYDRLVDYTTISVTLEEVVVYTETEPHIVPPKTVGQRVAAAFGDSTKAIGKFFVDVFVFLAGNVLYFLMIAVFIIAVLIPVLRHNAKQRKLAEAAIARRQAEKDEDNK